MGAVPGVGLPAVCVLGCAAALLRADLHEVALKWPLHVPAQRPQSILNVFTVLQSTLLHYLFLPVDP